MNAIIIVVVIILIYIYIVKLHHPDHRIVTYDDIKDIAKSGDIIMFISLDSMNQIFMASNITHIGVVYRKDKESNPVLIESFNNFRMPFYPKEYKTGIADCDLEHRLNSYRGFVLYKELVKPIPDYANIDFEDFIDYAKKNMKYDQNVISNEINRILFNTPFTTDVNCGTFTVLILIKLNLLDFTHFKNRQKHHLRFTAALTKLKNNSYREPVYVYSEYFKVPS